MAQRRDRRGRSRKRRKGSATRAHTPAAGSTTATPAAWRESVEGARVAGRGPRPAAARRERPRPPWHPLPLAEMVILVGTLAFVVGLRRGPSTGGQTAILLGVAAVALGTIEFMAREHRSGFRSHTVLLSILPVVVFHTVAVLLISAFVAVSVTVNLALVAVDVALFALAARFLRVRYSEARHEQLVGGPRRRRR